MRIRGFFSLMSSLRGCIFSRVVRELQMRDAEYRAARVVPQALDFPPVRQNDLLNDRQSQTGPFLMRREIRLENFQAVLGQKARAIVPNFQNRFPGVNPAPRELKFTTPLHRLPGLW